VTDEELKELVASLAAAQKETAREMAEFRRTQAEANEELRRRGQAAEREMAEFRRTQAEANEELRRRGQAAEWEMAEFRRTQAEANHELRKQLGGLGNKFGDFAEGMAIPSLIDILAKRFGAERILESRRVHKGEEEIELDLIGASDGQSQTVVAAEVKSVLNQRELDKFIRNLRRFFEFFPQFQGYKLYGVLAAVDSSKEMDAATLAQGIGLARMHGDIFRLVVPPAFQPKDFSE
jgi:hypothetical protein